MKLVISSGKKQYNIEVKNSATVKDLKIAFAQISKKSIHRVSFKKNSGDKVIRLDDEKKLISDYEITDGDSIQFKDLGPQIDYTTVFIVEYAGPLIFVLLYASRPSVLYGPTASTVPYNWVALLGVICWTIHFLKRELETLFVHRFSRPTMPLMNLFKNSIYYWSFGIVIGIFKKNIFVYF